jgi:hypothetical protein
VFPMVNPYPKVSALRAPRNPIPQVKRPSKDVLGNEKEWYNHYE